MRLARPLRTAVVAALVLAASAAPALAATAPAPRVPAPAAPAPAGPAPAAPGGAAEQQAQDAADAKRCGLDPKDPTYLGTSSERRLTAATVDPYKVADFPCPFGPDVRGIRLDGGTVYLVAGGALVRSVPVPADADGAVRLEDVVTAVADPSWLSMPEPGVVELTAALVQDRGSRLLVAAPAVTAVRLLDNPDVAIVGDGARVDFDGVSVTSWDAAAGAPVQDPVQGRPFLVYKNGGQLNATGSTFARLGSDRSSSYGVSWRLGTSGTVRTSTFDHNFFGVYTYETSGVVWEDSTFSNNVWYGLDPHTDSSDLVVRNNEVFGNGHHGIIFSQYVTDSLVEGNDVHDNRINGIMMDFRSDGNTIRGNTVTRNGQGVVFAGSGGTDVHDNVLVDNAVGVRASRDGADGNRVHDNRVSGGKTGVQLYGGATTTTLADNTIAGASEVGVVADAPRSTISGNTITGTPVGVRVDTATTVRGGRIEAAKTAIDVQPEGFATVVGVEVSRRAAPLLVAEQAVVRLVGTRFSLPAPEGAVSALEVAGVAVLAFAALSQVVHLSRRRAMRRLAPALASGALARTGSQRTPEHDRLGSGLSRFVVRPAVRPARPGGGAGAPGGTGSTAPAHHGRGGSLAEGALSRFRPDVEGLRAVAVVAVVAAHAALGVPGGYVGVDVFFVISGFLITRLLLAEARATGRISFAGFWARRARRILPAATVVTLVTLGASVLWAPALRLGAIAADALSAALFSVNWRLAARATDYFDASSPASPFQHYWSLSVEEQFYLAWPLLLALVLLGVHGVRRRTPLLAAVLVVGVAASLWASVHLTPLSAPYSYFGTHTRAWELGLGALVALGVVRVAALPRAVLVAASWTGLAAIVAACFAYGGSTAYPGAAALLPVGGAALVIAGGCAAGTGRGAVALLGLRPLRAVGRISYSLYLWHWPLLVLVPQALRHELTVIQRLVVVGFAVLLAFLTHRLVEQPFLRRSTLVARPRRALALGAALVATSVAAALVVASPLVGPRDDAPATTPAVVAALQGAGTDLPAALAAAAAAQQLPATLTPSLAGAAEDFPDTRGCEVSTRGTGPKLPCDTFGDPRGTKDVVLVGDSHAGMWVGALDAIAKERGWRLTVYAKSGCPVGIYTDYVSGTGRAATQRCNAWREEMTALVQRSRPDAVVIGSQARSWAQDHQDALTREVTALGSTGADVVFLGDTPAPPQDRAVPDCLAASPTEIQRCALDRDDAVDVTGRQAEMDAAARGGAVVVDPTSWFCTAEVCPAVVQDVVVYADASHVTATYALLRRPQLDRALAAVLG